MRFDTNLHRLQFNSDMQMNVKFDVNVFSNIKTNVAIYITRQRLLTHVANNCHVQFYQFIPRHFEVFMKHPKTSVSVSFEFGVDMSWKNSM